MQLNQSSLFLLLVHADNVRELNQSLQRQGIIIKRIHSRSGRNVSNNTGAVQLTKNIEKLKVRAGASDQAD